MSELTLVLFELAVCLLLGIILIEIVMPKKTRDNKKETLEQRVERLEKAFASNSTYLMSKRLGHKLEKLDNFRMNATVEIKALKESIEEIMAKKKKGKKKKSEEKELTPEEIKRLIYRSK